MIVDVFVGIALTDFHVNVMISGIGNKPPRLKNCSQICFKGFVPTLPHALKHGNLFLLAAAINLKSAVEIMNASWHTAGVNAGCTTARQAGNCNAQSKYDSEFALGLDHMLLDFQKEFWK
jgi:hypothetical protein